MDCLNLYCKNVIQPLEKLRNEVAKKYYTSLFRKRGYKKLLDKMDDELLIKYRKLETMIDEEIEFEKSIKNGIK